MLVAAPQLREEPTVTVHVDLVNVLFTVCNRKGNFVPTDLGKEHFNVYEDGSPQVITNFSKETDLPLTIALVIDSSGSVRDKLRFEQDAAIQFLDSTLKRGRDKALVFTFETAVDLLQDYTDDPHLLAKAVRNIRAGGGTRLYDSLYLAMEDKLAGREGRRGIILISDGDDTSSRKSLADVVESAHRNNITIYTVSTNAMGIRWNPSDHGDKVMRTLAQETGGKAFFPARLKELPQSFEKISKELRAQYTLAYRSTNANRDGSFRKIRIEVTDKRYSVRARSGYYAAREVLLRR